MSRSAYWLACERCKLLTAALVWTDEGNYSILLFYHYQQTAHALYCILLGCTAWASWPWCNFHLPCARLNREIPPESELTKECHLGNDLSSTWMTLFMHLWIVSTCSLYKDLCTAIIITLDPTAITNPQELSSADNEASTYVATAALPAHEEGLRSDIVHFSNVKKNSVSEGIIITR